MALALGKVVPHKCAAWKTTLKKSSKSHKIIGFTSIKPNSGF